MLLTLGARNDSAGVGSNIHACDSLVVALELILELEVLANLAVELDGRVPRNS